MYKYSSSRISNLNKKIDLISRIKEELKDSDIVKELLKEFGKKSDVIDGIVIKFEKNMPSSAKTENSDISINEKLIGSPFQTIMRYAIHEFVHALQHMTKDMPTSDEGNYLDDKNEIEAFQSQIRYEAEENGDASAKNYVNDLLEYHEMPECDKEKKSKELLEKVD